MPSTIVFENTPKVPIDELLHELEYEFTDAPHDLIAHMALRTIARLCEQTNVLRRTAKITTYSNVENYLLEPPDCMDVIAVMSITEIKNNYCSGPVVRVNAPVFSCCCGDNNIYVNKNEIVFSNPSNCAEYLVNMSVKPTRNTCEVDEELLTDYLDAVISGTRATLLNMTDKPWSTSSKSPALPMQKAQAAEKEFMLACGSIAVETMLGKQRGAFRAKRQRAF